MPKQHRSEEAGSRGAAHARLIAAAPELQAENARLRAALEVARSALADFACTLGPLDAAQRQARAVLARLEAKP